MRAGTVGTRPWRHGEQTGRTLNIRRARRRVKSSVPGRSPGDTGGVEPWSRGLRGGDWNRPEQDSVPAFPREMPCVATHRPRGKRRLTTEHQLGSAAKLSCSDRFTLLRGEQKLPSLRPHPIHRKPIGRILAQRTPGPEIPARAAQVVTSMSVMTDSNAVAAPRRGCNVRAPVGAARPQQNG